MKHAALIGLTLALGACGGGEDATALLAQTGEPGAQERQMLDDAASMLDEETAQPLPSASPTPDGVR